MVVCRCYKYIGRQIKQTPVGGGMWHQRIWFLSRYGLKLGIDFYHFGLKV